MPVLVLWSLTNDKFYHTASGSINLSGSSPFTLDVNSEFDIDLIGLVLSGGSSNTSSSGSLGGNPSAYPVAGTNNNLFSDISQEEKQVGTSTDFRCFYVFNDNPTGTFYNTSIFINSQIGGGSDVQIGIDFRKDIQKIVIAGSVSGGSFTMEYLSPGDSGHITASADYNANADIWAANIQKALNYASAELDGIVVTTELNSLGQRVFTLTFDGINAYKFHENLRISQNNLTPGGSTITVSKIQDGSPIDAIATTIDTGFVRPSGVTFFDTNPLDKLFIGSLRPGDGFPVWVKRVTTPISESTEIDGFTIAYLGTVLKSQASSKGLVWHIKAGENELEMDTIFQDVDETTPATADNTRIKRWVDITPHRHNFITSVARPTLRTKASATNQSIAKPAIWSSLDGTAGGPAVMDMQEDSKSGDKAEISFSKSFHLFFIIRRTEIDATLALVGNSSDANAPYIAHVGSGGVGKLNIRCVANGTVDNTLTWPSATNQSQILEVKRSVDGFVDAAFNGGTFTRLFSNIAQTGTFRFNRLFGHSGLNPWGGYMAEALAFNQALDNNDRFNKLIDLSTEYSITLT